MLNEQSIRHRKKHYRYIMRNEKITNPKIARTGVYQSQKLIAWINYTYIAIMQLKKGLGEFDIVSTLANYRT